MGAPPSDDVKIGKSIQMQITILLGEILLPRLERTCTFLYGIFCLIAKNSFLLAWSMSIETTNLFELTLWRYCQLFHVMY